MAREYLVRIPPDSPRAQHTLLGRRFLRSLGWVGPLKEGEDDALIAALQREPLNELHPERSARVFEVRERAAAARIHTKEHKKKKPAGTPDKPNEPPKGKGGRVGQTKGDGKGKGAASKADTPAAGNK